MCNFVITDFSCSHTATEREACTKKSFPYTHFHQCTATEEIESSRARCPECRRQRQRAYLRQQPRTIEEARALHGWQLNDPTRKGLVPSPFLQGHGVVRDECDKPKPPPKDMKKSPPFAEPGYAEQGERRRPKAPPKDPPKDSSSEMSKEDIFGAKACKGFLDSISVSHPVVPSLRVGKANCTSFAEDQEDVLRTFHEYSGGLPRVIHTKQDRPVLRSTRAKTTIGKENECFFDQQPKGVQAPPRLHTRKQYSGNLREQFKRANTTNRKENELYFNQITTAPSFLDIAQRTNDHPQALRPGKKDTTFQVAGVAHIPVNCFFRRDATFQATRCDDMGNHYTFRRHSNPNPVMLPTTFEGVLISPKVTGWAVFKTEGPAQPRVQPTETSITGIFEVEGTDTSEMTWLFERATRATILQERRLSVAREDEASRSYKITCHPVRGRNQASEPEEPAITSSTTHILVLPEIHCSSPFNFDGKAPKLVASKSREALQRQQNQASDPQEFATTRSAVHAPVLPEIRSPSPMSLQGSFGILVPSTSRELMRGLHPGRQENQVSQSQAISGSGRREAMRVSAQRTQASAARELPASKSRALRRIPTLRHDQVSEAHGLATCSRPLAHVPVLPAIRPVSPLSFEKILEVGILNLAARKMKVLSGKRTEEQTL